jgi:hypothetical protein
MALKGTCRLMAVLKVYFLSSFGASLTSVSGTPLSSTLCTSAARSRHAAQSLRASTPQKQGAPLQLLCPVSYCAIQQLGDRRVPSHQRRNASTYPLPDGILLISIYMTRTNSSYRYMALCCLTVHSTQTRRPVADVVVRGCSWLRSSFKFCVRRAG